MCSSAVFDQFAEIDFLVQFQRRLANLLDAQQVVEQALHPLGGALNGVQIFLRAASLPGVSSAIRLQ